MSTFNHFFEPPENILVSRDGGHQPRWRADGKELFYLAADGTMMTVRVGATGNWMLECSRLHVPHRCGGSQLLQKQFRR